MLKALFKKQMMEVNAWLIQDKKSGKKRSKTGIIMIVMLYLFLFASMGIMFYMMGEGLCAPLLSMDLGWLYFAIMGLVSILLGIFGSVFNTYATLYKAKDNEFLLSMPILPSHILAVRLFGVWMWSLIYEAIVFVPALIVYWRSAALNGSLSLIAVLFGILLMFLISVFILTLSCILGWVVAKISTRLKNKSIVTVVASLAFIGIYYYAYFRAYEMLQNILLNAATLGVKVKTAVYPLYLLGCAGEGKLLQMLLVILIVVAFFAAVYLVMSRSFLKIATANYGAAKTKYKGNKTKKQSVGTALLIKEARRFAASPTYMLNCGLGTVMLIIVAGFMFIKGSAVTEMAAQFGDLADLVTLVFCAGICSVSSMNDITAPSVSLEGKNIWIAKSLPISAWQVLKAKLGLHLIMTEIPTLLCSVGFIIAMRPDLISAFSVIALPTLFVLFSAAFGLALNLKMPNLKWTDETVPVKQGAAVGIALFGGWGIIMALSGLYFFLKDLLSAQIYLLLCVVLFAALSGGLLCWLKTKGTEIFEAL